MGCPFTDRERALFDRMVGRTIEEIETADDGAYLRIRITHPGLTEVLEVRIEADGCPLDGDTAEHWLTVTA